MAQEWRTGAAGKFFCPHCGALYEASPSARPAGDATDCVLCRKSMSQWSPVPVPAYRLVQRPEADF